MQNFRSSLDDAMLQITKAYENDSIVKGIWSGFIDLDQ
jgi:replicative DNA helicase